MKTGRAIVVAVRDEAYGQMALQRALRMAQSPQDRFYLVHVARVASWQRVAELLTPAWMTPGAERDPDRYGWLRRLSTSTGTAGRVVEFAILDGEPGKEIVAFARRVEADLIVVSTPREGQARELFIGSTALRILRTASCPVLVARVRIARAYAHTLMAVDLDEAGQRVVRAATQWLGDTKIDLVHGFRVPQEGQLRMHGHTEEEISKLREFMQAEVTERLEVYRAAVPHARFHVEQGFAASVILDVALRLQPDVLVLGKHRGSSTDERVIGSVAQFMLYTCPTDIMLVP
jgi:nucleotide-binding universal stress UspA family protein